MDTTTRTGRRRYVPPPDSPMYLDHLRRLAGHVLAGSASTQKAVAMALGCGEPWVSRLANGHPSGAKYIERVGKLARHNATEAGAMAALPFLEMAREHAAKLTDDRDLETAIDIALVQETRREGVENELQVRRCVADPEERDEIDEELIHALVESIGMEMEALGLLWERRRRRCH